MSEKKSGAEEKTDIFGNKCIQHQESKNYKGDLVPGVVKKPEKENIVVDLGHINALLPREEQIPGNVTARETRVLAYILDVVTTPQGPQVILSRTYLGFLIKLFEQEVPEISEGIVEVKGATREPGRQAKIAVYSPYAKENKERAKKELEEFLGFELECSDPSDDDISSS